MAGHRITPAPPFPCCISLCGLGRPAAARTRCDCAPTQACVLTGVVLGLLGRQVAGLPGAAKAGLLLPCVLLLRVETREHRGCTGGATGVEENGVPGRALLTVLAPPLANACTPAR